MLDVQDQNLTVSEGLRMVGLRLPLTLALVIRGSQMELVCRVIVIALQINQLVAAGFKRA